MQNHLDKKAEGQSDCAVFPSKRKRAQLPFRNMLPCGVGCAVGTPFSWSDFKMWRMGGFLKIFWILIPITNSSVALCEVEETLNGHVPRSAITRARDLGDVQDEQAIELLVTLPSRDPEGLAQRLKDIQDPASPYFHQFLTPQAYEKAYGPAPGDSEIVRNHFRKLGFRETGAPLSSGQIRISANARKVQDSLGIRVRRFDENGSQFFSNIDEPRLPRSIAVRVGHIAGLNNIPLLKSRISKSMLSPSAVGEGPVAGLSPLQINSAYSFPGGSFTGLGQTVALFQMDGFTLSDITAYNSAFQLRSVPLEVILVDGVTGSPGANAIEVTMDIQLVNAVAPGLEKILVYEGPNNDVGILDTYRRIATDGRASVVSTSWGLAETLTNGPGGHAFTDAENLIFQQMALQGQTVLAASGDSGSYDGAGSPYVSVDDPAAQPYVTGVGGTSLSMTGSLQYSGESVWNNVHGSSGGGVSQIWPVPTYQLGTPGILEHPLSKFRGRNVPDVALNADPLTGYAIFQGGRWWVVGGTSCGAPLWAGFTAILNQHLGSSVGFMNPALYNLARWSPSVFHDVVWGNNQYSPAPVGFSAVSGYDPVTGLGSLNASAMMSAMGGLTRQSAVTLAASDARVQVGSKVYLNAGGGNGSGTVSFYLVSGKCQLSGNELIATAAGVCSVIANKSGDAFWYSATSLAVNVEFYDPPDGRCGAAADSPSSEIGSSDQLCASGVSDKPLLGKDGRYHWFCYGTASGVSASCYSSNGKPNQAAFWLSSPATAMNSGEFLKVVAMGGTGAGKVSFRVMASGGGLRCRYTASGARLTLKPRGGPGVCVITATKAKTRKINDAVSVPLQINVQ